MDSQLSSVDPIRDAENSIQNSSKPRSFRALFIGASGVRSGWRVLLFYAVLAVLISSLVLLIRMVRMWLRVPGQTNIVLTPARALLNEGVLLMGIVVTSAIFAKFEGRSFADYGLPLRKGFGAKFAEGLLWGLVLISTVLLVLKMAGNFSFGWIDLTPPRIALYALAWAAVFALVGIAEGFIFSGYALFALTRGLGFWPAAALLAALFGAIHLATNPGENWLGSASLVVVGLLLPFTLRRTGDLWFAIGIHAAWDWAQSFLYGVPDSGINVAGHVFNPSFYGSKWMTGGTAGPEASVVTLLGYVFVFALINFRFPKRTV